MWITGTSALCTFAHNEGNSGALIQLGCLEIMRFLNKISLLYVIPSFPPNLGETFYVVLVNTGNNYIYILPLLIYLHNLSPYSSVSTMVAEKIGAEWKASVSSIIHRLTLYRFLKKGYSGKFCFHMCLHHRYNEIANTHLKNLHA